MTFHNALKKRLVRKQLSIIESDNSELDKSVLLKKTGFKRNSI